MYNPNGEIGFIANNLDTGRNQTYTLRWAGFSTASSSATLGVDCWGQSFTIHNVGNLTNMAVTKCSAGLLNAAVNQNNQFTTGYSHDLAGNLTNDGTYTYAYNGENEITSANGVSYVYDGNRRRIERHVGC